MFYFHDPSVVRSFLLLLMFPEDGFDFHIFLAFAVCVGDSNIEISVLALSPKSVSPDIKACIIIRVSWVTGCQYMQEALIVMLLDTDGDVRGY